MRNVASSVCLFLAVIFPLLLNGQTFTNSILGIAFAIAAVAFRIGTSWKARSIREVDRSTLVIAILAVNLVAFLLVQLPGAYTFQKGFNEEMGKIGQKRSAPKPAATEAESDDNDSPGRGM